MSPSLTCNIKHNSIYYFNTVGAQSRRHRGSHTFYITEECKNVVGAQSHQHRGSHSFYNTEVLQMLSARSHDGTNVNVTTDLYANTPTGRKVITISYEHVLAVCADVQTRRRADHYKSILIEVF